MAFEGLQCLLQRPLDPLKPTLLVVTPFALFPPSHGGARRMYELFRRLAQNWNLIILSDEGDLYPSSLESWEHNKPNALYLATGRNDLEPKLQNRCNRIHSHSRPLLQKATDKLCDFYNVDIVLIEYVELSGLIKQRCSKRPWVIDLHDVLTDGENKSHDQFELQLIRKFDQVLVTSKEDQQLLDSDCILIENGVDISNFDYQPSTKEPHILFAGPFRYPPNIEGACQFATLVYPELKKIFPELTLTLLGGNNAKDIANNLSILHQPGIKIIDQYVSMKHPLAECAITINPVTGIRGSPLKVIESVAAGRVCVTTHEGSRGFSSSAIKSLLTCKDVISMKPQIINLLTNHQTRHDLEVHGKSQIKKFDWDEIAQTLNKALTNTLMRKE